MRILRNKSFVFNGLQPEIKGTVIIPSEQVGVLVCAEMLMGVLNKVPSQTAVDAMDVCRILIRERDFTAIDSLFSPCGRQSSQETLQCDSRL